MKSENLNFLEPSGPLQACNGIAADIITYLSKHVTDFDQILHQGALFIHPNLFCIFITGSSNKASAEKL